MEIIKKITFNVKIDSLNFQDEIFFTEYINVKSRFRAKYKQNFLSKELTRFVQNTQSV